MKKLLILLALFPFVTYGYDVLSTPFGESPQNEYFQEKYQFWCGEKIDYLNDSLNETEEIYSEKANKVKDDEDITELNQIEYRIFDLEQELEESKEECQRYQELIDGSDSQTNIRCGTEFIKSGDRCLSPTEICTEQFGENIVGVKHTDSVSACTCTTDYTFDGGKCIEYVEPVNKQVESIIKPVQPKEVIKTIIIEKPTIIENKEEPVKVEEIKTPTVVPLEQSDTNPIVIQLKEPEETFLEKLLHWFFGLFK